MSLVSARGLFLGILGWNATTHKSIGSPEWWMFGSNYCLEIVALGRLGSKDLESLQAPLISRPSLASQNKESSDQTSYSAVDSDIDLSLFKDFNMDLDLGIKRPVLQNTSNTSKSVSFAETIQTEVYPFWKHLQSLRLPFLWRLVRNSQVCFQSCRPRSAGTSQFRLHYKPIIFCRTVIRKDYQLTREEDKVMQEWISDNLAKGFIRNSSSPYGAPCFFVKQKDKLRLCMDYRGLNKQTIKDRNPIPLISEMLRNTIHRKDIHYFRSPWRL
ncbi:hypothetical protein BASA83_002883 [Batrachochytrium salamandrivorans]|nr:hypothetical protein BASA83_002883 [Batrachochytrium salamandrivorans]